MFKVTIGDIQKTFFASSEQDAWWLARIIANGNSTAIIYTPDNEYLGKAVPCYANRGGAWLYGPKDEPIE